MVIRNPFLLLPNERSKLDLLALQALDSGQELAEVVRASVPIPISFMLVLVVLFGEKGNSQKVIK